MEDTRKIGLFRAVYNVGESMTHLDTSTDSTIEWDDLRKKDFEYAGVNEAEQKVLGSSLEKIKLAVAHFFANAKSKVKKAVSHLRESDKSKNDNIVLNEKEQKINNKNIKDKEIDERN